MTQSLNSWENDQDYLALVADLLENKEVQELRNFVHHRVTNRLDHSITVSYISYTLAKKLNLDYQSVARAGLLHDFFLLKVEEVEALKQGSHNNYHPILACANAERITTLNPIEKDIILKHMFLVSKVAPPKYKESLIVSMVDKYAAILEVASPINIRMHKRIIKAIYRLGFAS